MNKSQSDIINLKEDVSKLLDERKNQIDGYDIKALSFIINYLDELAHEYQTGQFKPKNRRFSHMAKIITDRDDSLISVDLGERLIKVEQTYIEH